MVCSGLLSKSNVSSRRMNGRTAQDWAPTPRQSVLKSVLSLN